MLNPIGDLPKPIQAVAMLGAGCGIMSVVMMFREPNSTFWKIVVFGIVGVVVLLVLFKLFLKLKDKAKSGPFANLIAKAGSGRGAVDPAQKARMDDLRKKFEEGVNTFKSAGKDLYSLPWFLLVGPSGSGKTEAMRHCNVGFPPGLQDCLQGTGGTMNMHWWFTNNAVVLDTAGRMFMEEAAESGSTEWKEFMKLLKDCRPNAPINGMLLVISSESLLKESAESIEKTAGAIARQLDVVQRTLDVRFPVFVVVTKCDKIVGFREFFETLNDPQLQHQMLGWSNPAPLDEVFKPDQVDKHLETVRQRLIKRRMGLIQNPVHTRDQNARRTDEVDEMFELPDNLVRIAPRLRRYLELIFVAGEWSPKPLFLRGIYFTSSMREGQALDMTLASALGIDVDSIPGGKEWDKDKAYFLRDVFLSKVFKEKGLVTRAVNVNKALAKQRGLMVGGSIAAVVLLVAVGTLGWFQYRGSLVPHAEFWGAVSGVFGADKGVVSAKDKDSKSWAFQADMPVAGADFLHGKDHTLLDLLEESSQKAKEEINTPLMAKAVTKGDFRNERILAHRALVEHALVVPLINGTRSKISQENVWKDTAVSALAQLIRLETYANGASPADPSNDPKNAKLGSAPIDVDALFRYLLDDPAELNKYEHDREKLLTAVAVAYPKGWTKDDKPSTTLQGGDTYAANIVKDAVGRLNRPLTTEGGRLGIEAVDKLFAVLSSLGSFATEADNIHKLALAKTGQDLKVDEADKFAKDFLTSAAAIADKRTQVDQVLGPTGDFAKLKSDAETSLGTRIKDQYEPLEKQLPSAPEGESAELAKLRSDLKAQRDGAAALVKAKLEWMAQESARVAGLLVNGNAAGNARAYQARAEIYKLAADDLSSPDADASTGLAAQFDLADNARRDHLDKMHAWELWQAAPGSAPEVMTQHAQTVDDSKWAVQVSRGRKLFKAASRLLGADDRNVAWPQTDHDFESRVASLVNVGLAQSQQGFEVACPEVPLAGYKPGDTFEKNRNPKAVKGMLEDWSRLQKQLDNPPAAPDVMVGRVDLQSSDRFAYKKCDDATRAYVQMYIKYWRDQALKNSLASDTLKWEDLQSRLGQRDVSDFFRSLVLLREEVHKALGIPMSNAWADALKNANAEVDKAFAPLVDTTPARDIFQSKCDNNLKAWKALLNKNTAKDAAEEFLKACAAGTAKDTYFSVRDDESPHWAAMELQAITALANERESDLKDKWGKLVLATKGPPFAKGADAGPDVDPTKLKDIYDWSRLFEHANVSEKDLPAKAKEQAERLSGASARTPQEQAWAGRVSKMATMLQGGNTRVQILPFVGDKSRLPASGVPEDGSNYRRLKVGKDTRSEYNGNPDEQFTAAAGKNLELDLPLTAGADVSIETLKDQPETHPGQASIATFPLPGPWHILRAACLDADGDFVALDAGNMEWRVRLTDSTKKSCIWVIVRFVSGPLPMNEVQPAKDWPSPK